MKRIDNLKDMPNTQEVVINIPKNINVKQLKELKK